MQFRRRKIISIYQIISLRVTFQQSQLDLGHALAGLFDTSLSVSLELDLSLRGIVCPLISLVLYTLSQNDVLVFLDVGGSNSDTVAVDGTS